MTNKGLGMTDKQEETQTGQYLYPMIFYTKIPKD